MEAAPEHVAKVLNLAPSSTTVSDENIFSLTNTSIPQVIFLGKGALSNEKYLKESIIHELAHIWLGMINEVSPLADSSCHEKFTLPSGTSGKSTLGTLLAAHFAGSALSYYKKSNSSYAPRITYLEEYLEGCLTL